MFRRRIQRNPQPCRERPSGARFGVQASLYPRSAGRRSGRHHLSCRNRWRYMADVRQRNERPQLAKRRIRNVDPRTDPVVQFEHRCEPHHRRPLPQQPGEIRKGYLPYRSARRPEDSAGGSNASQNPHAAQKQERTI